MNKNQDLRIIRSKECLLDALLLLLQTKPLEQITVKEITQKAGVSRQTFYAHFDKKEDILTQFLEESFFEIGESIQHETNLNQIVYILVDHLKQHISFYKTLLQANLDYMLIHRLERFFKSIEFDNVRLNISPSSLIKQDELITFLAAGTFFVAKKLALSKEEINLPYYCHILMSIIQSLMSL